MTSKSHSALRIWALLDERAGNRSQVLGVAETLSKPYDCIHLISSHLGKLPNIFLGAGLSGITPKSRQQIKAPWPDLIIAAGRRTAPIARYIKKMNNDQTFICQIMTPGKSGFNDFDLIASLSHDMVPDRTNVLQITTAPNCINAEVLQKSYKRWAPVFEPLRYPRIAVLMGGSTKNKQFTPAMTDQLIRHVHSFKNDFNGSLIISTSPRSGDIGKQFLSGFADADYVYDWQLKAENPYMGLLAWADHLIVTGESVSMCSEACASKAQVHVFAPKPLISPKHARFLDYLYTNGLAIPLEKSKPSPPHTVICSPINSADDIAREIIERLDN